MSASIKEQRKGLRTWVEIDRAAISANLDAFRALLSPKTKLCSVVKANAYGHDFMNFAKEMVALGVDWLAVDSVTEGLRLRAEGVTGPILILGYTMPDRIADAIEADLSLTISQFENLDFLSGELARGTFAKKPKLHIKVDTGMHRQGFMRGDEDRLFATLKKYPQLQVEGVFSHFAAADVPSLAHKTHSQLADFNWWREAFLGEGFKPIFHIAATTGTVALPEAHFDMVRIGVGLFGVWPSQDLVELAGKRLTLRPALSWKAIVSEIKRVAKGESVGYDFTETLERDSTLAVVPVGYWHGFDRGLSGRAAAGEVLIGGRRAKVVGRVSMSMIVVDITGFTGVKVLDEVVIIGTQGSETIGAPELAKKLDTNVYEPLTRLNPLMKRIYF